MVSVIQFPKMLVTLMLDDVREVRQERGNIHYNSCNKMLMWQEEREEVMEGERVGYSVWLLVHERRVREEKSKIGSGEAWGGMQQTP